MRRRIINFLELHALPLLNAYRSIKIRRDAWRHGAAVIGRMRRLLGGGAEGGGIRIASGPFKGLVYLDEPVVGPITPKWLGSYEHELAAIVEKIIATDYATIIDAGCAEGYYAVGLARRMPRASVMAYDIDYGSRRQTRRLARLNGVGGQVRVRSRCSHAGIARRAAGRALVICDIEGCERALLDPVACDALRRADILVEAHEGIWLPPTSDLLKSRFNGTHCIEEITSTDREGWIDAVLQSRALQATREELRAATDEHRDKGQKWLWMTARRHSQL